MGQKCFNLCTAHILWVPFSPDYNLIELVWHSSKEYIAGRLFETVDQLKDLLDRLLNKGELEIKWGRKLKNKGNLVNAI